MKNVTVKPLGDRVLVEPLSLEEKGGKTKSGFIIPDTVNKERPEQGKVIAVGPGWHNQEGKVFPLPIKKGQIVLFSKYGPDEIKIDGKEYYILSESNILAVIE